MEIQNVRRANLQRLADASTIGEIARKTGRPISQICDVLSGRKAFGEKLARKLEKELVLSDGTFDSNGSTGFEPIDLKQHKVPLVSWGSAASPNKVIEEFIISDIDNSHLFALRVVDNSMGPLFTPGDVLVFVEESQPAPGKYVLAAVGDTTIFRRYKQTGLTTFELVPENPDFPTIKSTDGDVKVIAVMVESRKYW